MKAFYQIGYKYFKMPWEMGPRRELVQLVTDGKLQPGRVIDLGCGTGSNCVFLAQNGFTVTGLDFAESAIEKARQKTQDAGVNVEFIVDDLTNIQHVEGQFDLLVDYGTLDDIHYSKRDLYIKNVIPLSKPKSYFLMFCFEWEPRWWERSIFNSMAMHPGEVYDRFEKYYEIEKFSGEEKPSGFPKGYAVYLMKRK